MQKFLREQARLYLDTHLPLTRQDDVAVQKVYAAVSHHSITLDLKAKKSDCSTRSYRNSRFWPTTKVIG
jgi:hypothetical protein